jgi:hypothetical protein
MVENLRIPRKATAMVVITQKLKESSVKFGVCAVFVVLASFLFGIATRAANAASSNTQQGIPAQIAICTPTGFFRDGINMTAAMIDPHGTVTGQVDATGCNIGVYYGHGVKGTVSHAEIFGANYFGVVNDGGNVTIKNSSIHNIGEVPFNGTQHGVGIYFSFGSGAKGEIQNNQIWNYQKNGIVVSGAGTSAEISGNTVTGQGPVNYIAQNGIEIGFGAKATVTDNAVSDNSYTGDGLVSAGGILAVGGACYGTGDPLTTKTEITGNHVTGNDVGVWLSNLDASCGPATTPTKIEVKSNISRNDNVNNTSGAGAVGSGYQAGISDQGDQDVISKNQTCGLGYTPVTPPPPFLMMIDVTYTNDVTLNGNTICSTTTTTNSALARSNQIARPRSVIASATK